VATALVTGASAGLGAEYTRQLAADGWDLVLVARDRKRLEAAATSAKKTGVEAEVLPADLSERSDLERVVARIAEEKRPIDLLINNAGYGFSSRFEDTSPEVLDGGLDVMVRAVMVLSQAAARAMRSRGHGAILNVSSIAAQLPGGVYAAHKAWVKVFTEGLASDLRGSGVTATAVLPGLVHTEFHERAHVSIKGAPGWMWLDPPQVVKASLRAVRRGKATVTPTFRYKVLLGLAKVTPRAFVRRIAGKRERT